MTFPLHNATSMICTGRRSARFMVEVPNWGGVKIHFVKRKSNRDGKFRNVETRFQSSPEVKGFQYKRQTGTRRNLKNRNFLKLFETFWTNDFFSSQKWGPKKWQHIMNHNFFWVVRSGCRLNQGRSTCIWGSTRRPFSHRDRRSRVVQLFSFAHHSQNSRSPRVRAHISQCSPSHGLVTSRTHHCPRVDALSGNPERVRYWWRVYLILTGSDNVRCAPE